MIAEGDVIESRINQNQLVREEQARMLGKQPAAGSNMMKTSQTMPQLYYTSQDIQEQYLTSKVRTTTTKTTTGLNDKSRAPLKSALEATAGASQRARSSEHQKRPPREPPDSSGELDTGSENEEPPEGSANGRGRRTGRRWKRQRRAHSLFSGCFHLPESLSSMLSSAGPAGQTSQKRSILAHLRLGGHSSFKRPISASRTAVDLQQVAAGLDDDKQQQQQMSTGRKHVSFGQQRPPQQQPAVAKIEHGTPTQPLGGESSGSRNNTNNTVIMRNYIAHQPPISQPANSLTPAQSSPIYLVSQRLSGPVQTAASPQVPLVYHNQAAMAQLQRHQQHIPPAGGPPLIRSTPTLYRRLPAVPTRTQATQTEITAYHLMAAAVTPSPSPASSSAARRPVLAAVQTEPLKPDDDWSASSEDEDDEGVGAATAGGNLNASTLASDSSNSSSAASLVAHDCTLVASLKCEPSILAEPAAKSDHNPTSVSRQEQQIIEPPQQFKDSRLGQQPSDLRGEGMNMNGPGGKTTARQLSGAGQDEDRAASPPSLSEASSQTDASLAAQIIDIGRQIGRAPTAAGGDSGRDKALESEPPRGLTRDGHDYDHHDDDDGAAAERWPASSPDKSRGLSLNGHRRHTNRPYVGSTAPQEEEQERTQGGQIVIDNSGQSDLLDEPQLEDNRPADCRAAAASPSQEGWPSSGERRRDHFLTLDRYELPQLAGSSALVSPPVGAVDDLAATDSSAATDLELHHRPSTSTLSTRHHSYCSTSDEFQAHQAKRLQSEEEEDEQQQQDEDLVANLDLAHHIELAAANGPQDKAFTSSPSIDHSALDTIRRDCGPFMAPTVQDSKRSLEDDDIQLEESCQSSANLQLSSCEHSPDEPPEPPEQSSGNSHQSQTAAASPPTTVSELDQDEELSTPSFVDSYRAQLRGQLVELADRLVGELVEELVSSPPAARSEDHTSTSASSTTTSLSGASYACCGHARTAKPVPPEKPAHLRRPSLPKEERAASAAALAVTATSIAAAAVLHNSQMAALVPSQATSARQLDDQQPSPAKQQVQQQSQDLQGRLRRSATEQSQEGSPLQMARRASTYASMARAAPEGSQSSLSETGPALMTTSRSASICSATSVITARRQSSSSSGSSTEPTAELHEPTESSSRRLNEDQLTGSPDDDSSFSSSSNTDDSSRSQSRQAVLGSSAASGEQQLIASSNSDQLDYSGGGGGGGPERSPRSDSLQTPGNQERSSQELSTVSEVSEEASAPLGHQKLAEPTGCQGAAHQPASSPATELDLAQSDYTLKSQCSEAASVLTMDSSLCDVEHEDTTTAAARQHRASLGTLGPASDQLEARRRSSSSSRPAPGSSLKLAGVDCPYVRDIIPLSPPPPPPPPPPPLTPLETQTDRSVPTSSLLLGHQRLSHDDTMEAIEDDVEGEEAELKQQIVDRQVDIAPPAAFVSQHSGEHAPECIKEEEEPDDDPDDPDQASSGDDEESSISVSQQGVVVTQQEPLDQGTLKRRPKRAPERVPSNESNQSGVGSLEDPATPKSSSLAAKSVSEVQSASEVQAETSKPEPKEGANTSSKRYKSLSSESSTQVAMIEHFSRFHPLDEPGPEMEQSRPIDSQIRRETWRRESSSARQAASITPAEPTVEEAASSTGTMKRRSAGKEPFQEPAPVETPSGTPSQRRGPPLAQLKPSSQQQRPTVSSQVTDTSICSSCSCMEGSLDLSSEQKQSTSQFPLQQMAPNKPEPPVQVATKGRVSWMSQEEGTVFTENYWISHWLYICEHEEAEFWRRAVDMNPDQRQQQPSPVPDNGMPKEMHEFESTGSERNFNTKYKSTTRKMIHRRATIEMYKRMMNNTLAAEKRVEISRSNGEFGFRIHGSRPVVVSAIERGTSAETCGLQVGDLIYAINDTNILDMAHSDVVKLAHTADSAALVLDLVPTNEFLSTDRYKGENSKRYEPLVTGHLMRLSPSTAQPLLEDLQKRISQVAGVSTHQRAAKLNEVMRLAWRQRYFVLRSDNCLYWYKSSTDMEPQGGINLQGFSASLTNEFSEPNYVIRLVKYGGQPHYLGTNNICDIQTWIDAINKAATEANQNDPYMKRTLTMARCKPDQIPEPDCGGYLYKFSHKPGGGAHWRAAYFLLKDACLYLYREQEADSIGQASAVYYLHGYRVRSKHIENKKHTFELIPPNRKTIKPMFLMANSEMDKKRWIAALEYSIDRWIEID